MDGKINKLWFISFAGRHSAVVSAYSADLAVATVKKQYWFDQELLPTVIPLENLENGHVLAFENHEYYDTGRKRCAAIQAGIVR